jgi:hypothetical protein
MSSISGSGRPAMQPLQKPLQTGAAPAAAPSHAASGVTTITPGARVLKAEGTGHTPPQDISGSALLAASVLDAFSEIDR